LVFISEDSKECHDSAEETEFRAKISKEHVESMFGFAVKLSIGFYGEDRKQESEKYYLMSQSKI
jgi:hypothetical protein